MKPTPIGFGAADQIREWAKAHPEEIAKALDPTSHARGRELLSDQLRDTPLLREYIHHIQTKKAVNALPKHALGERLYWMFVALNCNKWASQQGGKPRTDHAASAGLVGTLMLSQVYLLMSCSLDAAYKMPDLPRHVISREAMQFPCMFFSNQVCQVNKALGCETNMFLLTDCGHGMTVTADLCFPGGDVAFTDGIIQYGSTYPDDFTQSNHREATGFILKLLAFLNSSVVNVTKERMARGDRRRMEREGMSRETVDTEVSVIRLRSIKHEPRAPGEQGDITRHHHWWVRGHWRAQWFASEAAHHIIWIDPHIKGDTSKPMLDKVYVVDR